MSNISFPFRGGRRLLLATLLLGTTGAGAQEPTGGTQLITFAQALARARTEPAKTEAAISSSLAQASAVEQAQAAYLPTASLTGTASGRHQNLQEPPPSTSGGTQSYGLTAVLDWQVYDFGRRASRLQMQKQLHRQAAAQVDVTRLDAQLLAAEAYLQALSAGHSAALLEQILARRKRMLTAIKRLVESRMKPEVDQKRAMLRVTEGEYELNAWNLRRQQAEATLAVAMGMDADSALTLVSPQELTAEQREPLDAATCRDAHIRAADAYAHALEKEEQAVHRQKLPTVGVQVTLGYNRLAELYGSPAPPPFIISSTTYDATASLILRWEGLDLSLWHQADAAEHRAESARHSRDQMQRERALLLHNIWASAESGWQRASLQRDAVQLAKQVYSAQQERFSNGLASTLELLDSGEDLDRAELQLQATKLELDVQRSKLLLLRQSCRVLPEPP